jgi:hypothetical protein
MADPNPPWDTDFTLYLRFPGVYGITGVNECKVGYKASATHLLSHLRLESWDDAGHGRFTILNHAMWVRLRGDKTAGRRANWNVNHV